MNELISKEIKIAMKYGDKLKLSVLRMLKSALQLEAINKKTELTDGDVISVIIKQVKTRKDSITEFEKYNKLDAVKKLQEEIDILSIYLPEEMTEEEIIKVLDEVFAELQPTSMKDMSRVMKEVNTKITNADMSLVSKLVKERLSSN